MITAQVIAVLNVAALAAIMLSMGLQVKAAAVASSLRRVPLVVACVSANFVLVPAAALVLLYLFQAGPMASVGFFILAVCPGAPVSPPMVALAKGDLPLAIGMMVLLAGLSAVLSPALLSVLLTQAAPGSEVTVDYLAIVRTLLVAQLLPLAVGLAIYQWVPKLAERIARLVALLANVLLLGLLGAIIAGQYQTLAEIRVQGWGGMILLLLASLAIGWVSGGRDVASRKSLAVTTGPRNAAVGLAIATSNFPGTVAVTAVVAYGLMSILGTLAAAMLLGRGGSRQGSARDVH